MGAQGTLNRICLVSYQTGESYLLPLRKLKLSVSVHVKDLSFLIYTLVNRSCEKQASHFRYYLLYVRISIIFLSHKNKS